MRWSIRTKLTILILFSVLGPLSFLGSHIYRVTTRSIEERIGQSMRMQASTMIDQIDGLIFERAQNIQSWTEEEIMFDVLGNDENNRIRDFLMSLKRQYSFYAEIICADNTGEIIASTNPSLKGQSIADEKWFGNALKKGRLQTTVEPRSNFLKSYNAVFASPILTENILKRTRPHVTPNSPEAMRINALDEWQPKTLGVVAAWINWSDLINLVNGMPVLEGEGHSKKAYVLLMSREGLAISQPFFEERAVLFRENLKNTSMKAPREASEGRSGYTIEMGRYGETDFIGYAPSRGSRDFKGFGWAVLIFQNAERTLAPIRQLRIQILAVTLFVAGGAALLTILLAQGVSRPIEKLAGFARAIGRGDFSGSFPVKSKDEVGLLAVSFNEMIGNLKNARNELLSARDFTENIIKSIPDALIVIDPHEKIRSFNPAALRLLGYEEKEFTGLPVKLIFTKEFQNDTRMSQGLRDGTLHTVESEFVPKNGNSIPVLFSVTLLHDPSGKPQGTVLIARDLRDYKSLQNQFLEAQKMDAIGRLAGGVAHDFNNMLTVINGYSEDILIGRGKADSIPRKVGEVLKAGRRASRLVSQLLSFSRRQVSKPEIIDINRLVQGMDKMLKLITGVRIQVNVLLAHDLSPVKIDSGQFEQVLTNLTVNARDAMPEGGKIFIETKNVKVDASLAGKIPGADIGDYVLLEVRDTGTGMTEEIKRRIFEPFFTTKPKGKGTGLGLSTCFDFIKASHGFIDVNTAPGKGSAFKLYFPKSEGKPQNMGETEISQDIPPGTERILLVDDEDLVREFYERALSGIGYTVFQASNGSEALNVFQKKAEGKIDVLLTDVVMPGMDGPALVREMLKTKPDLKVVFMSGYVEDDSFFDEINKAGFTFLQKPVMLDAVALKLREILNPK